MEDFVFLLRLKGNQIIAYKNVEKLWIITVNQAKHFYEEEGQVTCPGPDDIAVLSQHDVVTFSPALHPAAWSLQMLYFTLLS